MAEGQIRDGAHTPYDGGPHAAGNGQMVAFLASSRATVIRVYETALAHGAASEGAPGLRPEYHADYFGAYFRDPEGNKICMACHEPEQPDRLPAQPGGMASAGC